jgi:hypothetical protein
MRSPAGTVRSWLGKLIPGLLLVGVGLVGDAFWLSWQDHVDFQAWRTEQLKTLGAERGQVLRDLDDVHARLKKIQIEIPAEEERIRQAHKIIAELNHLASTWDRLVGNPEQQKANAEQLAHMTKLRTDAAERLAALQQESKRTGWERDGLEITRAGLDAQFQAVDRERSTALHYLGLAWRRLRTGIICTLALYGLGCLFFYLRIRKS